MSEDRPRPRPGPRPETGATAEPVPAVRSRARTWLLPIVSVLLVVSGVVLFVAVRHHDHRSAGRPRTAPVDLQDPRARLVDPSAAQAFVAAAVSEVVAVTQSDYRSLDNALQAGLSVTTGEFRTRFEQALTGTAARQRIADRSVTSASVLASGIGTTAASGRTAKVLVVVQVNQSGRTVAAADRQLVTTLCLTLVRHGAQYLISDMVQGADAGLPTGTTGLSAAAAAARAGVGGSVSAIAARQVSDDVAVFLVAATGATAKGAPSSGSAVTYSVTVRRSGSSWRASSVTPVS